MDRKGWLEVFQCGTDYEAELVRSWLSDAGIPVVILNHRDHAFNLTHGFLAKVKVVVPESYATQARELLDSQPISDDELARQAMERPASDPD